MYSIELSKTEAVRIVAVGSSCTVSIQDITIGSPSNTELQYYSPAVSGWVSNQVFIPMVVSPTDSTVYFYSFNAVAISPNKGHQEYLVVTRNGAGSVLDSFIVRVGSPATQLIERISSAVAPAARTLTRSTDTSIRISCFSDVAMTKETLRLSVTQDSSGNQPEETQLDISSSIT